MRSVVITLILFACACPLWGADPEGLAILDAVRKNADKFELLPLQYDDTGHAIIQYVDPAKNFFLYNGRRYFGFRFKAPEKLEGDFAWMYLLRSADGPTSTGSMNWYIVRRLGEMEGFEDFMKREVSSYPELKAKFPHTSDLTIQFLDKESFNPNEEYAIWFSLEEGDNTPQFAVAFSFMKRGQNEAGLTLPLGPKKGGRSPSVNPTSKLTSYEGDPW